MYQISWQNNKLYISLLCWTGWRVQSFHHSRCEIWSRNNAEHCHTLKIFNYINADQIIWFPFLGIDRRLGGLSRLCRLFSIRMIYFAINWPKIQHEILNKIAHKLFKNPGFWTGQIFYSFKFSIQNWMLELKQFFDLSLHLRY